MLDEVRVITPCRGVASTVQEELPIMPPRTGAELPAGLRHSGEELPARGIGILLNQSIAVRLPVCLRPSGEELLACDVGSLPPFWFDSAANAAAA